MSKKKSKNFESIHSIQNSNYDLLNIIFSKIEYSGNKINSFY